MSTRGWSIRWRNMHRGMSMGRIIERGTVLQWFIGKHVPRRRWTFQYKVHLHRGHDNDKDVRMQTTSSYLCVCLLGHKQTTSTGWNYCLNMSHSINDEPASGLLVAFYSSLQSLSLHAYLPILSDWTSQPASCRACLSAIGRQAGIPHHAMIVCRTPTRMVTLQQFAVKLPSFNNW